MRPDSERALCRPRELVGWVALVASRLARLRPTSRQAYEPTSQRANLTDLLDLRQLSQKRVAGALGLAGSPLPGATVDNTSEECQSGRCARLEFGLALARYLNRLVAQGDKHEQSVAQAVRPVCNVRRPQRSLGLRVLASGIQSGGAIWSRWLQVASDRCCRLHQSAERSELNSRLQATTIEARTEAAAGQAKL